MKLVLQVFGRRLLLRVQLVPVQHVGNHQAERDQVAFVRGLLGFYMGLVRLRAHLLAVLEVGEGHEDLSCLGVLLYHHVLNA